MATKVADFALALSPSAAEELLFAESLAQICTKGCHFLVGFERRIESNRRFYNLKRKIGLVQRREHGTEMPLQGGVLRNTADGILEKRQRGLVIAEQVVHPCQ